MKAYVLAQATLIAILGGCASNRTSDALLAKGRRYECSAELQTAAGKVASRRMVDVRGQQIVVSASWDARNGQYTNPWITGFWVHGGNGDIKLEQGDFRIMWHVWKHGKNGFVPQTLRLELHRQADNAAQAAEPLVGKYAKSSGPFHFEANWADVAKFAESGSRLTLLARDKRGHVVDQTEIDAKIISPVSGEIRDILDKSAMLARGASHQCKVEGADNIVVT